MRIMIKGGVWKNTEDEILKAAVMKYGKNQWARISSLLVRKSAKQCKARWYEWLDPSIKKTEWTREEDEKLLHLAKLMPTQWRTIAPIVGRTPSQCLERYEKLLDAACVKDENYEPADDPRKLRPGEIDPNPESKPARPDPVDMDEDEKEMLSEARARLANTRGKKAKRKAREKQLEEARRLASLQKRRELKAAGIEGKQRKRKRKGIDYNAEIPFEKKPPPGFFDVADEGRQVEQPQFPTTIEELEGKRRVDIEAQLRKQDVARNKIVQRHDTPSAVMQVNKLNDPEVVRKRSKLMLPAPQISDRELEEIAKMGYASDLILGEDELAEGSSAARDLLANYNQTPRLGTTPLRTPQRTPGGKGDAIMMEAENQARLREAQTPLFGGENPELHPSDFSGVTPKKREVQTPNPISTPLHTPGAIALTPRSGMTPSRELSTFGMTPKGTPIRDELRINEGMETPDGSKAESQRQAEIRRNLRAGLGELPAPQNEYQIVVPDLPVEDIEVAEQMEEDMSDKLAREKAEEAARQAALLRKRSKVLQRDLPRPPVTAVDYIKNFLTRVDDDNGSLAPANFMDQADELIRKELVSLLEHDNAKYPFEDDSGKEKRKGSKNAANGRPQVPIPQIDDFDEEELREASQLVEEEVSIVRVGMGHAEASVDDFAEAHDACLEDMMFFPGRNTYGLASVASGSDKLASLQNEFENVRNHMESGTRKAVRLEQKLKVLTQGYQMRAGKLWTQLEAAFKQADTSGTELECFRALHKQEELAASNRIESLREVVSQQKDLERRLQIRYENLLVEQDNLQRLLQEYKERIAQQNDISKGDDSNTEKSLLRLEADKVVAEALEVLSKGNDVAMLGNSEAIDGDSSLSQMQDSILKVGTSGQKDDVENCESATEMQTDHIPHSEGPKTILDDENADQAPHGTAKEVVDSGGQTAALHSECIEQVVQQQNNRSLSQVQDSIEKVSTFDQKRDDVESCENITEMQTDHVPQPNAPNAILDEKIDQAPLDMAKQVVNSCGQTATSHTEYSEQVVQQKTDLVAPSNGQSTVADDMDAEHERQQNTDMVAQADCQNAVLMDDNVEQAKQHNTDMVAQPNAQNNVLINENVDQACQQNTAQVDQPEAQDGVLIDENVEQVCQQNTALVDKPDAQNDVLIDENVEQACQQNTALVDQPDAQNDVLMGENVEEAKQHDTDLVAQSDGKNALLKDEVVEQVKEEKEMTESSVSPQIDISKDDVAGPVKLQVPLPDLVVDLSLKHPDKQVEVSHVLEQ
ncbi:hypothetical protein KI387_021548, partial [Taxus chinensis]